MTDQKLVDELEKALTDEAYDGGIGALDADQFRELVRTLAVTAAEVVEKAHTPTDDEREALVSILEAPLAEESRGRTFSEMLADVILVRFSFRRTEVSPVPPCSCPCHTTPGYSHIAACCAPVEPQGEPSDAQDALMRYDHSVSLGYVPTGHESNPAAALRAASNVEPYLERDIEDSDLIAWHAEQVELLRPFRRSRNHLEAAMMHAATVRALRAAAQVGGEGR